MPGRQKIHKEDYLFDGDLTLVGLTAEVHQAMKSAMEAHTWPFLEEFAGWDNNDPESKKIHFTNYNKTEYDLKVPQDAISTLQNYMPMLEAA